MIKVMKRINENGGDYEKLNIIDKKCEYLNLGGHYRLLNMSGTLNYKIFKNILLMLRYFLKKNDI